MLPQQICACHGARLVLGRGSQPGNEHVGINIGLALDQLARHFVGLDPADEGFFSGAGAFLELLPHPLAAFNQLAVHLVSSLIPGGAAGQPFPMCD